MDNATLKTIASLKRIERSAESMRQAATLNKHDYSSGAAFAYQTMVESIQREIAHVESMASIEQTVREINSAMERGRK